MARTTIHGSNKVDTNIAERPRWIHSYRRQITHPLSERTRCHSSADPTRAKNTFNGSATTKNPESFSQCRETLPRRPPTLKTPNSSRKGLRPHNIFVIALSRDSFELKAWICSCRIQILSASFNSSNVNPVPVLLELAGRVVLCRKRRHHAVTRINLSKLEYLPGLMTLTVSCGGETVTNTAVVRRSFSNTSRLLILSSLSASGQVSGEPRNQVGPCPHFSEVERFFTLQPRLARSAGLSSVGMYHGFPGRLLGVARMLAGLNSPGDLPRVALRAHQGKGQVD
ncbi:hypothetical protein T01_4850 [Trichinella spiralis]|uniref:Uncharacterized protein n=1 Tax=Trichinella spiralis TaxID=6334 RepID=A0A0V1BZK5_TRISP|nr:hypothetical protein T01_4850 [Trichinella spiralis]